MGIEEEVLQPKSDGTTQHRGRRLGNVECKEHTYQMTVKEAKSKTVSLVKSLREEREPSLQVGYIATVEDSSHISCFPVGTLSKLEPTKLRTTLTRSRRQRGRPRVGGRKNRKKRDYF